MRHETGIVSSDNFPENDLEPSMEEDAGLVRTSPSTKNPIIPVWDGAVRELHRASRTHHGSLVLLWNDGD